MIKNKWMHRRFSYHEWLMIGMAAVPVIVIIGIVGYLIGAMI